MAVGAVYKIGKRLWVHGASRGVSEATVDAVGRGPLVDASRVAGRALQGPMGTAEREETERVLEVRVLPELLLVALAAIGKSTLVNIVLLVAEQTFPARAREPSVIAMAFLALQSEMHAGESETPVKILREFPSFVHMALLAPVAIMPVMGILVARGT